MQDGDHHPRAGTLDVRVRLRQDTAALHARAEERMRLDERLACDAAYRALLERFHGLVGPLEAALSRFAWPADLAFPARTKAHLLARDLAHLGHDPADLAALPACRDLPALHGPHPPSLDGQGRRPLV